MQGYKKDSMETITYYLSRILFTHKAFKNSLFLLSCNDKILHIHSKLFSCKDTTFSFHG